MLERQVLEDAMRRALTIARRGPAEDRNPQVGCVVLDPEGRIVAEGWHRGAGSPHAEVDALAQLGAECRARAATLTTVVTLEPCNHFGHTGPCAEALRDAGIGSVAYAATDPGATSGGGSRTLEAAGVQVLGGVLADEARALLGPWLSRQGSPPAITPRRPHVTVKWAQTLDGRAAAADGSSQWITGPAARADVHRHRAAADAILVGTGTLYTDDPALTARNTDGSLLVPAAQQPVPVVLGRREVPVGARIRQHPALAAHGVAEPWQFTGEDLARDLARLTDLGVRRLFVEGGPAVVSSFIAAGLVDEVLVYLAPALLGGPLLALGEIGATSLTDIKRLRLLEARRLGDDLLVRGEFAASDVSPGASPDALPAAPPDASAADVPSGPTAASSTISPPQQ